MRNLPIKAGLAATILAVSLTGALAGGATLIQERQDAILNQSRQATQEATRTFTPRYAKPVYDSEYPKPDLHWNEGASIKASKQSLSLQQSRSARPIYNSDYPKPDLHWNEGASID